VVPVFLGLQTKDALGGFFTAPTELGAFAGCIAGVMTVFVNGYVNGDVHPTPFHYFLLHSGYVCAVCGRKTMWTFVIVPCVSGFITYLFSFLDVKIRGERARQPIIPVAFDKRHIYVDEESLSKDSIKVHDEDDLNKDAVKAEEDISIGNNTGAVVQAEVLHLPGRVSAST